MARSASAVVVAVVLVPLLALSLHVSLNSPISPLPLPLPPAATWTPNNFLQTVEKLGEGVVDGPEDLCFDGEGTLYTATADGWIKRMHANGSWEDWKLVGGRPHLLGVALSRTGHILVCDAEQGLLKVGEEGVLTLTSEVDGTQIRFADEVIESSDGTVYFSVPSTTFGFHEWMLDILHAKPSGRLLKYDPHTKETSVVLENLAFANGVALSSAQDFLLVCETWKFRCLKYWLKGELKGQTEVFVDNLPGGPDNIILAPDGSFWVALLQLRSPGLDLIHGSAAAKKVVAAFPKLVELISRRVTSTGAMVVNVGSDGKILRWFDDLEGKTTSFATSAVEFEGHLYIGGLFSKFIAKLPLNRSS